MDKEYQGIVFFWKGESGSYIRTSTVYGHCSLNRNKEHTARPKTAANPSPAEIHATMNT